MTASIPPASPSAEVPASGVPATAAHPRGIYTLFFTEMWERMSYYGMRALLVLYMVDTLKGGMGFPDKIANSIYGLYTCAVYLVALPGGWIADRLLGQQQAVMVGGIIIALGHFTLAYPSPSAFFLGMLLVILGTALLKPSVSSVAGQLYPEGGARRDAGFTLFYMGVNLGGFLGPLVCGYLADRLGWHWGFAAAGVGMTGGVIQYSLTRRHLGHAGSQPSNPSNTPGRDWAIVFAALGIIALVVTFSMTGAIRINPVGVADYASWTIAGVAAVWFVYAFALAGLTATEKKRLSVVAILFGTSALFWSGFEQAGSSMNLFAKRYTQLHYFNWDIPAAWFQSINSACILIFAPVFSWLWLGLAQRKITPSISAKFSFGLVLLAAGFLVMFFGSKLALAVGQVSPLWLITTYLLHTWGELALSPVGLSAVTKLAPAKLTAQTMGIWFLASSLGNLLAGRLAGEVTGENAGQMPVQFMHVVIMAAVVAVALAIFAKPLRRLASGAE